MVSLRLSLISPAPCDHRESLAASVMLGTYNSLSSGSRCSPIAQPVIFRVMNKHGGLSHSGSDVPSQTGSQFSHNNIVSRFIVCAGRYRPFRQWDPFHLSEYRSQNLRTAQCYFSLEKTKTLRSAVKCWSYFWFHLLGFILAAANKHTVCSESLADDSIFATILSAIGPHPKGPSHSTLTQGVKTNGGRRNYT